MKEVAHVCWYTKVARLLHTTNFNGFVTCLVYSHTAGSNIVFSRVIGLEKCGMILPNVAKCGIYFDSLTSLFCGVDNLTFKHVHVCQTKCGK